MKVIDLLNKIANGEDVPKKIKYNNIIYNWDINGYLHYEDENFSERAFLEGYRTDMCLNDEVEILEEPKGIPEKLESYISCGWNGTCKDLKREELFEDLKKIGSKTNEIIDYLEYLESKGDE